MQQEIIEMGDSVGFVLPEEMCEMLGLREGDEFTIEVDKEKQTLLYHFPKKDKHKKS